jgi:Uma2 family endonuclease
MNAPSLPPVAPPDTRLVPVMPDEPVLPLSVDAYHTLLQAGVFQHGDPIELLEGFLVLKMTKGPRHETTRRKLRRLLERLIAAEYFVDEQGAITTADSEPEPDVFVIHGDIDDFPDHHPGPEEAVLIAEVADSSIKRDRGLKHRVYARAKVQVYWIIDLVENRIDVFTQPSGPSRWPKYQQQATYLPGEEVPVVIDGEEVGRIAASEVLGSGQPAKR